MVAAARATACAGTLWRDLLFSLLPVIVLVGVFLFVFTKLRGSGGMFSFGKAKAKKFSKDQPRVTFDDVAGADEAVEELREIRDFLKDPSRFHALGAKIPQGCCCTARRGSELRSELAMLLGGRTAEEMIFGDPTTGAADDIDRVTQLARKMVTQYGMSDALGPFGSRIQEVFLGKDSVSSDGDHSDGIATVIDAEVRTLIDVADREAEAIGRETLDEDELAVILGDAGRGTAIRCARAGRRGRS